MKEIDIINKIKTKFPENTLEWVEAEHGDNYLFVPAEHIDQIVKFIKEDWDLSFDHLVNLSACDMGEHLEATYHFDSYKQEHKIVLKVKLPRQGGKVNTLSQLYGTAIYQEREAFDHFGITFVGHSNLKRLLLPDDWEGFPLLKDYQEKDRYHEIETTRPSLL